MGARAVASAALSFPHVGPYVVRLRLGRNVRTRVIGISAGLALVIAGGTTYAVVQQQHADACRPVHQKVTGLYNQALALGQKHFTSDSDGLLRADEVISLTKQGAQAIIANPSCFTAHDLVHAKDIESTP
jgi:hypothetical protein